MLRFNSHYYFLSLLIAIPFQLYAEEVNELDELIIISSRLNSDINSLPVSVSIITAEDIKNNSRIIITRSGDYNPKCFWKFCFKKRR